MVKRQLEAVGVDMVVEEAPPDRIYEAMGNAATSMPFLFDVVSGPSLFRPYLWWHSGGRQIRRASRARSSTPRSTGSGTRASDDEYRAGVAAFQQAMIDDPPAIFLAWGERARAVSNRFDVPAEPGRDMLATLRLWQPQADTHGNRN